MSEVTTNLSLTRSSFINRNHPDTAYPTSSGTEYHLSSDEYMYFGFAAFPSNLKRNKLVGSRLRIYDRKGRSMFYYYTKSSWTAGSVTWNTKPDDYIWATTEGSSHVADYPLSWEDRWVPETGKEDALDTQRFLQGTGLRISAYAYTFSQCDAYLRTVLSGGGAPYVEITYDNAVIVKPKPKISKTLNSTIDPANAQTLRWTLPKDGSDRCLDEVWTQASAKIRWRVSGAGSWNDISISGSTMSGSIPAYTLPTGSTLEYCVQVVDTDGNTTTSDTYTTKTPATQITQQNSPTSGYKNPRTATTFSWYFQYTYGNYTQASAALHWRETGESTWNDVSASGSTQSLTVAANTFPINTTVQWYLSGTDVSGKSSQTPVYTFSTSAATAYATLKEPVGTVEDGSKPIRVNWALTSDDGLQMSRIVLSWKLPSASTWTDILDTTEIVSGYTIAADYFAAGETDLKICAYNIDGVKGPDDTATFIVVAAPVAPTGLAATPVPRTTISWQSSGQEAYEIMVDGVTVQKAFGPDVYSWMHEAPLEDGEHIIRVRIQGIYGLWSEWSETSIFVQNVPPWTLTLEGWFGTDAELNLDLNGSSISPLHVHWYRDGRRIAWTTGTLEFTDRMALGEHAYWAEIWNSDGNYARSNIVRGKLCSRKTRIAAVEYGSPWFDLELSEKSDNAQSFSWSRENSLRQVRGATYPLLELSEFETRVGSYNCAFPTAKEAEALEALKGRVVILKSRGDRVLIGGLTRLSVSMKDFYVSCSFSVEQIHWEDFVRYEKNA